MLSDYNNVYIEVFRNSGSIDANYVFSETTSSYSSFSGSMQTLRGDERYTDDKQQSVKTYRIFAEHQTSSLLESDVLTISDTEYDIVYIDSLLQNDHIEIDVIGKV